MDYILKKLRSLKQEESWDYGNGFTVIRSGVGWIIHKHGMEVATSTDINKIGKEIKLTFIAIEVTNRVERDA